MKKQLVLLFLAMGLLLVGCAAHRNIENRTSYDYPPRWAAYAIHPVGAILNAAVVGPMTGIVCTMPDLTGCTPNDEMGIR